MDCWIRNGIQYKKSLPTKRKWCLSSSFTRGAFPFTSGSPSTNGCLHTSFTSGWTSASTDSTATLLAQVSSTFRPPAKNDSWWVIHFTTGTISVKVSEIPQQQEKGSMAAITFMGTYFHKASGISKQFESDCLFTELIVFMTLIHSTHVKSTLWPTLACWIEPMWVLLGMVRTYTPWWFLLDVIFHFCPPIGTIKTMAFHLSTSWSLLGPWFSVFPDNSEAGSTVQKHVWFYWDHGFIIQAPHGYY